MLKKMVAASGIVAVVGLGIGGATWANANTPASAISVSSSNAPAVPTTSPTSSAAPKVGTKPQTDRKAKRADRAKRAHRLAEVAHAQWVSKDGKTGAFVTHDAIRGDVTAVTTTSITIKAADGTSEKFIVNGSTKVRVKGNAKGTIATIGQVKVGDRAGVVGTGAGTMTATRVIDRGTA